MQDTIVYIIITVAFVAALFLIIRSVHRLFSAKSNSSCGEGSCCDNCKDCSK